MASSKTWKSYVHKDSGHPIKARKLSESCGVGGVDFAKGDYVVKYGEGSHMGMTASDFKAAYKAKGK
jgi:hypothetical protein